MSKPELLTVVCNAAGPRSLSGGRIVAVGDKAANVDITHPHNRALLDAGDLAAMPAKKSRGRKPTMQEPEEAAK